MTRAGCWISSVAVALRRARKIHTMTSSRRHLAFPFAGLVIAVFGAACGGSTASRPAPASGAFADTPSPCAPEMALIPAGRFALGAMKTEVTVGRYCLDVNEVTVADFKLCVDASACRAPDEYVAKHDDWGQFCNWQRTDRRDHPVNCVDWSQATAYCAWAKQRLPTESEWEWAARSGDKGWNYPWGNDAPDGTQANACGVECAKAFNQKMTETVMPLYTANDGWEDTAPVGSFPKGDDRWGVHDLAGNVAEWTDGAFDDVAIEVARVQRGGHWRLSDGRGADLMAAARERREPESRRGSAGFRCAMTP